MKSKKKNRASRRKSRTSNHRYESLEKRRLLAGVYHDTATGDLFIFGDAGNNFAVAVSSDSDPEVLVVSDAGRHTFNKSEITQLTFIGYGGDDTFTNDTSLPALMLGHAGNDTLTGGSNDDVIVGGDGDDVLNGRAGNDRVVTAAGTDIARGGNGDDSIFGSSGLNELHGNAGNDTIYGGNDVDTIFGGDGIDQIFGLGGDDIIDSGLGGVAGSAGIQQGDLVLGLGGNDTIIGGGGLDIFWGGDGDDILTGGGGENRIHGQTGNDTITGGPRADFLRGLSGNDTIDGGGGADAIDLGSGSDDTAIFNRNYTSNSVNSRNLGQIANVDVGATSQTVLGSEFIQFNDRTIKSDQPTLENIESLSYTLLNNHRLNQGLPVLAHTGDITRYAESWARNMSVNGFRHSSEADLVRFLVDGRTTLGENIIFEPDNGQGEAAAAANIHRNWINSPTHLANINNGDFSEVGVGIVKANGGWWGVHVFFG